MAENKMEALAKLLGVELEEEFRLSTSDNYRYKLTRNGIWCRFKDNDYWESAGLPGTVFSGIAEIHKSILTKKEKEYLSAVIKPFRDRVLYIYKVEVLGYECLVIEFLKFPIAESYNDMMVLPGFERGTTYKGMKLGEKYTLKELEL